MEPPARFSYQIPKPQDEFLKLLYKEEDNYDPVEKLLELERELFSFEQQYELSSAEFYLRYQAGKMGDAFEVIKWAGRYKLYLKLKEAISVSLRFVVAESQLQPT